MPSLRSPQSLALGALFALATASVDAAPVRSRSTAKTTVRARGKVVRATVTRRSGTTLDVRMGVPAQCDSDQVAKVIENELLSNPDAFRQRGDVTLNLGELPFGYGRVGSGRKGSDEKGRDGKEDPMDGFAAAIGDILATGNHASGGRNGGETCFDGVNFDVSTLVEHNANADPTEGSVKKNSDGPHTVTTENADGSITQTTLNAKKDAVLAVSTTKVTWDDGVSMRTRGGTLGSGVKSKTITTVTEDKVNGSTTVSKETKSGGSTDRTSTTTYKDGSSSTTTTKSKSKNGSETKLIVKDQHDGNGKHQQTETETQHDGKTISKSKTGPDEKKDKEKPAAKGGSPTLTPEGTFDLPPLCVPDEALSVLINWNKLQEAVTDPAPHEDGPGPVSGKTSKGPCGDLEDEGFDPDPAYLRPNEQRWVTDPVPALTGRQRRRSAD